MVTVEEKLNIFSKLVLEKVKNESDRVLEEMYRNNRRIIENHKSKIKEKGQKIIEKRVKNGNMKKNQMISLASGEVKKMILKKKQELMQKLIREIEDMAEEFTKKQDYQKFLINTLKNLLLNFNKDEGIIIYLTFSDFNSYKDEIADFLRNYGYDSFEVKTIEDEIKGGIIAENLSKTLRIDASLKVKIEENIGYIGQVLYEELEKAGDNNE